MFGPNDKNVNKVVGLFISIVMGCMADKHKITESLTAVLTHKIYSGLISDCAELRIGTYMVIGLLVSQRKIEDRFSSNLIEVMVKVSFNVVFFYFFFNS